MTELAFMIREDWAQRGTAMVAQSAVISEWLGDSRRLFAITDLKKYASSDSADRAFVDHLVGQSATPQVVSFSQFDKLRSPGDPMAGTLVAVYPHKTEDLEALRNVIRAGRLDRVFVIIWARTDRVRVMLEGFGGVDLFTGTTYQPEDPLMLAAAQSMVDEQYNGLDSGHGKEAVIQLVRAFAAEGYPVDVDAWLRPFFAAGGEVNEAEKVANFIREMQRGVKHRVRPRYVEGIVDVLRKQVAANNTATE